MNQNSVSTLLKSARNTNAHYCFLDTTTATHTLDN